MPLSSESGQTYTALEAHSSKHTMEECQCSQTREIGHLSLFEKMIIHLDCLLNTSNNAIGLILRCTLNISSRLAATSLPLRIIIMGHYLPAFSLQNLFA